MKNNYCDIQDNCEIVNQLKEQLVAKEKEGKEKSWEIGNLGYKIKNQRKEINKLQQQLDQFKKMLEDKDVQLALTEIRSGERHLWYNKAEKYEQTLTEIKEIAEKHAPRCNDNVNCNYKCEACHLSDLKQILEKISECEVQDVPNNS